MQQIEKRTLILIYILILFSVSSIPNIFKTLFVHPSGNISVIGPFVGALLSMGIFFRWKYIRAAFYFVFIPVIIFDLLLIISLERGFVLSSLLLIACHLGLLIYFVKSKTIRLYLETSEEEKPATETD